MKLFWHFLFALSDIIVFVLALLPGKEIPGTLLFWDKAQHTLAFLALTVLGRLAFRLHARTACIALAIQGALIEIMQAYLTTTRTGDVIDWVADCVGIALGTLVFNAWLKLRHLHPTGNDRRTGVLQPPRTGRGMD